MKRKSLSLLLALALALSLAEPVLAAPAAGHDKIIILHTNDVHCAIDENIGYAGLAAYKNEMESEYGADQVTLVDVGDAIQGGPVGTLSKGSYLVDIMNHVGYDLAVPGNHEFDYGVDRFLTLAQTASYPYLCCNFTALTTGTSVFDPYKIIDYGTAKVAYVGICTPETFTKSTPTFFQDAKGNYIYSFAQGNEGQDLYQSVQSAIDAARAAGADYVIGLGHLGMEGVDSDWTSTAVIANTTGMDALLGGHSHEEISEQVPDKSGKNVVLAQAGTQLSDIGKLTIDTATGTISSTLIKDYAEKDPDTAAYVDSIKALYEGEIQKVVAKTDVPLIIRDPDTGKRIIRSQETNLGDLCADAYRTLLGADVSLVNGGGIRAGLNAGDITNGDILSVHPFGNSLCLVEATGQQILDALELGARNVPDENGGFLQVSGLTYTIDASIPSSVVLNDEKEFVKVGGPYRVSSVKVGGEDLDLAKTYKLASHNYMLKSGGDGLSMFKTCKILQDDVLLDNQALLNYITGTLNGAVGSEYANPYGQGRITVKYVGVDSSAWYAQAAKYVMDQGLMTSTGSGFDPTAAVTRATVFQAFYNAEDKPAPQNASVLSGGVWAVDAASAYFADTTGTWYSNAANWAVDAGLANVPGDKLFHGDRTVTRAELATIIARYAESKSMDTSAGGMSMREMADYDTIPAWALHGMGVCYYNGILTGKPGDLLDPAGAVTRAELASSLMNYSKLSPSVENESTLTGTVTEVQKYGNLIMDFNPSEFLDADFAYGDVLSVTASGKTLEMPFGTSYSDVDSGSPIVRHDITNGLIVVAINMGDFSKVYGVAVGDKVSFARKEKAGYLEEYQIRNLDALRTNVRSDYASNEVFANFRPVAVGGIAEGVLYRSGSPVNNEIGRASCTDSLIRQAGVVTVVNLADSQEDLAGYFSAEDLPSSYYQSLYRAGNVCPLDMGVALMDADFSVKLKTGLEFMLDHKGPYLIHCSEGKDRAGFVSAILEALMGAGLDEIENDYMLSYENYYHVTYHSDQWYRIRSSNIVETLCTLTGAENEDALTDAALQKAAANYLTGTVGLTGQQLTALETILSTPSSIKSAA